MVENKSSAYESMNRGNGHYRDVMDIVGQNKVRIVRLLENISPNNEIGIYEVNFQKTRGMREGFDFLSVRIGYRVGGESSTLPPRTLKAFIKYFSSTWKSSKPRHLPKISLEKSFYDTMYGSGVVPKAYTLPGVENLLLLEHAGENTLEEKLYRNNLSANQKNELVKKAVDVLIAFTNYAGGVTADIIRDEDAISWLKKVEKRRLEDSARRYLDNVNFDEEDTEKGKRGAALIDPIIKVYDGRKNQESRARLIHGDGGAQNFVGPLNDKWNHKNIKLVDLASLKYGFPVFDLAQLLSSPGMRFSTDEWNRFIEYFIKETTPNLTPSLMKEAYTQAYAALVYEPCKRVIKMENFRYSAPTQFFAWLRDRPSLQGSEKQMGLTIDTALGFITKNPRNFCFDVFELKTLEEFRQFVETVSLRPQFKEESMSD